jgi:hypothetical protein
MCVKLYSYLMVIVYTFKIINLFHFTKQEGVLLESIVGEVYSFKFKLRQKMILIILYYS